ncbi:hypothetical protein ACIBL8_45985 [Streptomyces sp. NPDC050523]|uniref:hypothetical protein n=1 Tax=Streptomyces sp. NPDC050523 TaxID=3365622 RepID=UPI0037949C3F
MAKMPHGEKIGANGRITSDGTTIPPHFFRDDSPSDLRARQKAEEKDLFEEWKDEWWNSVRGGRSFDYVGTSRQMNQLAYIRLADRKGATAKASPLDVELRQEIEKLAALKSEAIDSAKQEVLRFEHERADAARSRSRQGSRSERSSEQPRRSVSPQRWSSRNHPGPNPGHSR